MYKQIISATDWYFRHDAPPGGGSLPVVYQIAAWALTDDGNVIGLVTVRDPETGRPKLVSPPPIPGDYLHREQLTEQEIAATKQR